MAPYESNVDRQIREAREAGAFDNLPGAGKPLPGIGGRPDPNWWVRQWVEREDLSGVLPPSLALARAIEDLPDTVAGERSEAQVRKIVAELNQQIRQSRVQGIDGPPIFLRTQDVERVVREWRERRGLDRSSAGRPDEAPAAETEQPAAELSRPRGLMARIRARRGRSAG